MTKRVKLAMMVGIIFVFMASIGASVTEAADNDTYISDRAYAATVEYGEAYGICPELLQALIEIESSGNPNATNGGCVGLCQIYGKYHYARMERLRAWNLYDERDNILVAADYLAELFAEYEEACLVLDIYNGNSSARWNYEQGIISDYANGVLKRAAELEQLHGK